ncbi:MAG: EAL domain-containing protein [Rhodoferax sp.]|nr:EAL domain-containing protein [Rhodoferax sp.]
MSQASWAGLVDALLEAVWVVDAAPLQIVAVNQAALDLVGLAHGDVIGKPAVELTATPEDMFFWEDVAAGLSTSIHSETMVRGADGVPIPVERRVSRLLSEAEPAVYLVGMRDLRQERKSEQQLETLLAELRATLESTADGILAVDLEGRVRNYNRRFAEIWSLPEALLVQRDDAALLAHMARHVADPKAYGYRLAELAELPLLGTTDQFRLASGRVVERVSLPQFSRSQPSGRVFAYRDITERTDTETRLRLAGKVFESSLDAIFITGSTFTLLAANPGCERMLVARQATLLGMSARVLFFDPHDVGFFDGVEQRLVDDGLWEGELWRKNGSEAPRAVQVSWVALRDDHGALQQTICFFKDLTEKHAAQQRIETLAYRDVLTGLPNRLMLAQRVDDALRMAERKGGRFAVFFLDLDRFKNINDSMGHAFGDRVLVEVASRIKGCLRDVDTLCRLGGDEFVVFLQEADAHGAEVGAQRILQALSQSFQIDTLNLSVGCSIGVALYPEDGKTLDELIQFADTAMYRVKERGRGNFRFYQPQMNVDVRSRMKMDHAMRLAMQQQRFRLVYQPQIDLATGTLVGAEALSRWSDPELGEVGPAQFIVLAEETGFIITIGNWVLQEAVRQAASWQDAKTPVVVSINVSALQFQQANFVQMVDSALRASQLNPALLELELTESILVQDAEEALARLHELAAIGVAMSIDDFGTGYSSLAYLKRFPISKLKIDRSFIMGLPDDEGDRAIVSATISMARALKLDVVAEGVETEAQRQYLLGLNCASFQGYLCAPGLPVAEFELLMERLPSAAGPSASGAPA